MPIVVAADTVVFPVVVPRLTAEFDEYDPNAPTEPLVPPVVFVAQSFPATVAQPPRMPFVLALFTSSIPVSDTSSTALPLRVSVPARRVAEPPLRDTVVRTPVIVIEPTVS